jgi:hypothetical protein
LYYQYKNCTDGALRPNGVFNQLTNQRFTFYALPRGGVFPFAFVSKISARIVSQFLALITYRPRTTARYADETFIIRLPKSSVTNTGHAVEHRFSCNSYGSGCRASTDRFLYAKRAGETLRALRFRRSLSLAGIEANGADTHGSIVFWVPNPTRKTRTTSIAAETTGSRQ